MTLKSYRTGIIGLGRIGFTLGFDQKREQPASHSMAFAANPRIMLSGGADIDAEKRNNWLKAFPNAMAYSSTADLINDGPWDILVVAVDERNHLKTAIEVIRAKPGLIVLEKPVAPNLRQALKIQSLARKESQPVCVNHERRFSKDYLLLKDWIKQGKYGSLRAVNAWLLTSHPAAYPQDHQTARGTLIHDSTHLFDCLRFVTGDEIKITSSMGTKKAPSGHIKGVSGSGKVGEAQLTYHIGFQTRQLVFELDLMFERGRVRIGNGLFEAYDARESPYYEKFYSLLREEDLPVLYPTGYFAGMAENCVRFMDGEEGLLSTLADGVKALQTADSILRKAR